jgi:hypothetical protein
MLKASFGEVTKEGKRALSNFGHGILHALEKQGHDVGVDHELLDIAVEAFCQPRQEIKSHNHEVFVWSVILFRTVSVSLQENPSVWFLPSTESPLTRCWVNVCSTRETHRR